MQVIELLEKCWNLKRHFKGTWNSLKIIIEIDETLEICSCLLFTSFTAINDTKNYLNKFSKESLKKIVEENS